MSVLLKILQCILCCEEEQHHDRYDVISYDTSVRRSSAPSYHDLLWQSPNLSGSDLTSSSKPSLSSSKPTTSSTLSPLFSKPPSSSSATSLSSTKASPSSSNVYQKSSPTPPSSSSTTSLSSTKASPSSSNVYQKSSPAPLASSSKPISSFPKPTKSSYVYKPPPLSPQPPSSSSTPSSFSSGPNPLPSVKKTLSTAFSKSDDNYVWLEKSTSLTYKIPKDIEDLIKKSSPTPPSSSSTTSLSSTKASPPSSNVYQKSSLAPLASSSKPISSFPKPAKSSYVYKPPPLSPQPPSSSSTPSSSSSGPNPLPSLKKTLSTAFSNLDDNYVWLEKRTSLTYKIPKHIEDLIKKDIVPRVLKMPLSPSTYKDYFAALLYAEDFYIEKWSNFKLENVTLELQKGTIYKKSDKNRHFKESDGRDNKIFVAFKIENVPEKRPFLLSRDFVFAQPSDGKVKPFQGILHRVEKSTRVLVEFADDFHSQHYLSRKYDVSFSFNRVCLKRAHQAIAATSDSIFRNFIFPNNLFRKNILTSRHFRSCCNELDPDQKSAVFQILTFRGPPPYLVQGPLCVKQAVSYSKGLSRTGLVVREAVLQICQRSPESRILICAPINNTCDVLIKSLEQEIPVSDMFRANAAFREIDGVPIDILPSCLYKGECFVCPPLEKLQKFRVILSTFISSFRLCKEGITAGHFTHIFLVDASSATEPETMVVLSNLADEKTAVVVTGAPGNHSGWVRSDIARQNGLRISYFERLYESIPYKSLDPLFITQLDNF